MHPLAIPCVAMAAINGYVASYYLLLYPDLADSVGGPPPP
jgi:hypothetical protein